MKRVVIFLLAILFVFFAIAMFLPFFAKTKGGPKDAAIFYARHDIATLAGAFKVSKGSNSTNDTIHASTNDLFFSCGLEFAVGLSSNLLFCPQSPQEELFDFWHTPYQVKIIAQTNFTIRSAGPNKIFGDADDIIFNSASNNFVKP